MPGETLFLKRFGRQLRIFRKQRMISREDLGLKTRLSTEDIGDLEAGNLDLHLSTLFLIARALSVHPEDLLIPTGGINRQYYAYRSYLLKQLNTLSKRDLKKAIKALHDLFETQPPETRLPEDRE